VLKKEATSSASKGNNDSDDYKDVSKNDTFMTQMRDKLETCSLNSDSSKQSSDYFEAYTFRPVNKEGTPDCNEGQYMAETIIEIKDTQGQLVAARALLDTGTTESIVLKQFVQKGHAKTEKGKSTVWNTLGGKFKTKRKALVEFKLPELSNSKKVTWLCHVDKDRAIYDIGVDLMTKIGLSVNTIEKCIN
jgi:predicted aspartyl protease